MRGWLPGAAVVREHELVGAIEVEHGDHVLVSHAQDFTHDSRAAGGVTKRNLDWLAFPPVFPSQDPERDLI